METDILNVFFACLAAFGIFKFLVEPQATKTAIRRLAEGRSGATPWVAFAQLGSKVTLLATLSAGAAAGLIYWLKQSSSLGLSETNELLSRISDVRGQLYQFNTGWGYLVTAVCVAGLAWFAFTSSKSKERKLIGEALDKELERLQSEFDAGEWVDLPPTNDMLTLQRVLAQLEANFEQAQDAGDEVSARQTQEQYARARQAHLYLDAVRRANTSVDPADLGIIKRKSTSDRLGSVFFSKGVVSSLNGFSRVLFGLGLLILFPSLLVATYQTAESSLDVEIERIEAHVEDLNIDVQFAQISQAYEERIPQSNSLDVALDEETEAQVEETARVFSHQIFPRMIARPVVIGRSSIDATATEARRNTIRQKILEARASSASGTRATVSGGNSGTDLIALNQAESPVLQSARRDLRAIAAADPDTFSQIRANTVNARNTFSTPASPRQLKRTLVSQFVGHAIDATPAITDLDPGLDSQLKAVSSEFSKVEAQRAYDSAFRKFALETSKPTANFNAQSLDAWDTPPITRQNQSALRGGLNSVETSIGANQGSRPSLSRSPDFDTSGAQRAVQRLATRMGRPGATPPTGFSQVLTSFDDYFPGQRGAELRTAQAQASNAIAGPSRTSATTQANATRNHARARSYGRLRGFSRVGGVLIGRSSDSEDGLVELDGIEWSRVGERIEISASLDGRTEVLGRFNPAIVHLALAYAADGRPTTVTMVTAEPVWDLRILVHPVLEDTGLGCHAIRLDQLADEYGYQDGTSIAALRGDAESRVRAEIGLYKIAWKKRVRNFLPRVSNQIAASEISYYQQAASPDNAIEEIPDIEGNISTLSGPMLISQKSAYFDDELITTMRQCLPSASVREFEACVGGSLYYPNDASFVWLAPYPQYQIWSGVRETSYELEDELEFVSRDGQNAIWPFRFMVQVAFESEAFFAGGAKSWNDEFNDARDNYVDENPLELEVVGERISEVINRQTSRNPKLRSTISYMSEFAVLQRLFRNALDGNLGEKIDLDALSQLAEETAKDVNPSSNTAKWLRRPGSVETALFSRAIQLLESEGNSISYDGILNRIEPCMALLSDSAQVNETTSLESISQSAWNSSCVFSGQLAQYGSGARELEEFSELIAGIREVRAAVGATQPRQPEFPDTSGSCPVP